MGSLHEIEEKELFCAPLDPVMIEIYRLESLVKEKERELQIAHGEIKALKVTELLKDKAVIELSNEMKKLDEKLRSAEEHIEYKNLEIKKLRSEKKDASAAQLAAEAALRRVHAAQRDQESIPIEAVIAPLESDIKKHKEEIAKLQEDKKALERHTKSKEAALLEAEKILCSVLERALIVEDVQNQNLELKKKIEIFQEENKLLDKTNRQKLSEIEKLTQTINKLEESVLTGGMAANAIRDYQRQVTELKEEKRALERELAKAKVKDNRVAMGLANEWKDENNKVMPVNQWLEERRFLQGEIKRWRDRLAVSERTAKAEAQLKDKLKLRLKTLEESLKGASKFSVKQAEISQKEPEVSGEFKDGTSDDIGTQNKGGGLQDSSQDMVPGLLYDVLQKEIINLRKMHKEKDRLLNAKEDEMKMLLRKVDTLTKAMNLESKRVKREAACKEKERTSFKSR